MNSLLKKDIFKTDIINGTTKEIQSETWTLKDQTLNSLELLDSPGFDFCNIKFPDKVYSCINHSDLILFILSGDLNRNELSELVKLAGIKQESPEDNITDTAKEKAEYQRKNNVEPGTDEWFKLWFARPKLTGEKPF